jgi:hypothetical protein
MFECSGSRRHATRANRILHARGGIDTARTSPGSGSKEGGIHAPHPFTSSPLAQKIATLARLASGALADYPHVAGITWSGAARCSRVPADERAQIRGDVAIQRGLPIEHLRQTVIVSRHLILLGQISVLAQACEREPIASTRPFSVLVLAAAFGPS